METEPRTYQGGVNDQLAVAVVASGSSTLIVIIALTAAAPLAERVQLALIGSVGILLGLLLWRSKAPYRTLTLETEAIRIGPDRVLFSEIVKIWVNRRKKTVILFLRHPIKGRLPLCMFWITKDSIDNVVHELHGRIPDVDVLETNRRGLFMLSPEIDRWLMRPPAWGRP